MAINIARRRFIAALGDRIRVAAPTARSSLNKYGGSACSW